VCLALQSFDAERHNVEAALALAADTPDLFPALVVSGR